MHGKRSCVFQRVGGTDLGQILCRCEDCGQNSAEICESHCFVEVCVEKEKVYCEGSVKYHINEKQAVRSADFLLIRAGNVYRGPCEVRAENQDERVANGLGSDLDKAKLGVDALEFVEIGQTAFACWRADQQQVNKRRKARRRPQQQEQGRETLAGSSVDDLEVLGDMRTRVLNLYRRYLRHSRNFVNNYDLDLPASQVKTKIRQEFERHRFVNDLAVQNVLYMKAQMEFQELVNFWKQRCHVMMYFEPFSSYDTTANDSFIDKFLKGAS
ncbi:hypothetical protein KL936_002846 [Ogataea polymorpha]|nr:hypothetical protein KL936_002846 [Ogataea polymorpha]